MDSVRAWNPEVPSLREVYHAEFDHAYPMHTHNDWTVMIVDHGAVAYALDNSEHFATTSAVTLLPPDIPHNGRSTTEGIGYRKRVLYLEHDWLPVTAQGKAAGHPTLTGAGPLATVRRIHQALEEPGGAMAAEHWLLVTRDQALNQLGGHTSTRRDTPLARRMLRLLDDRYTESFTIAAAAAELGAHPSHLTRVFSETYGIAPHQYLISRRIDLARRLLNTGTRPADAAAQAGFHDQAHLTRHFRRVLGTTPTTFVA